MSVDIAIIFAYFIIINIIGIGYSGGSSVGDYFLGSRSVNWMLVCLSIVATETSSLSFLSIPGLAYVRGMDFLQIAFGYLLGRILVAAFLLPKYFQGRFETVYQFLQNRFGLRSRRAISVVFHVTRLCADSVRLFATAIPLTIMIGWDYRLSLLLNGIATFIYTFYGGIRSVIVVDALQRFMYIASVLMGMWFILDKTGVPAASLLSGLPAGDLRIFSLGLSQGAKSLFGSYNIFSGLIGGSFLSFTSHGTDHLIVQRVLACKNERDARTAMIASGAVIIVQFALFLLFGLFLKSLYAARPFASSDEIVPFFIINSLPAGLRGVMLAGIFAAAMSTLASSINSLSSSTAMDLLRIGERGLSEKRQMRLSRGISAFWCAALIAVSMLFSNAKNPLVEIGLSIASITYGAMMGIFVLGRFSRGMSDTDALAGALASIVAMSAVALSGSLFWLWFVVVGFAISFAVSITVHWTLMLLSRIKASEKGDGRGDTHAV